MKFSEGKTTVTERSVIARGREKGEKETSGGNGYVPVLTVGGGEKTVHICYYSSNCALTMSEFIIYKLYLVKAVTNV